MSLEVDNDNDTKCSMKAIRNGYGLLCSHFIASSLFSWYHFKHRPFIYRQSPGVPYPIIDLEVSRLACLQLVGHYVACYICLTLWARPQRAGKVPGQQTLLHCQKVTPLTCF